MEWFYSLFSQHAATQAVVIICLISAIGLALGKIRMGGISLGVTFVFFIGILFGHLGFSVDPQMLAYAEVFGLVLFVYALGMQVGAGFFSSFRKGGLKLNSLALSVILLGSLMTICFHLLLHISLPDMMGILCGAVTNTPALGAAQQTLKELGLDANSPALSCAVTYPFGVLGVILALLLIRKLVAHSLEKYAPKKEKSKTFIAEYQVFNKGIFGKNVKDVARLASKRFVISRLWRDGKVSIPTSETIIEAHDRLLVVTSESDVESLTMLFGEQEQVDWNNKDIDWNAIDSQLLSRNILVTRTEVNGKKLGSLRLRNLYGINITKVYRSGISLLPTPDLTLQFGDRLTIVGESVSVDNVEKVLGNAIHVLKEPNLAAVFIGMVFGLILGSIPLLIPGISLPVKLGIAGGPIVIGILIGAFGPKFHMITYTTRSANLMLRGLGLSTYLACLGLDSGAHFFETVFRPEGLLWIGLGFSITLVPVILVGIVALKGLKMDLGTVFGMLCGSMANPMALNYANDIVEGDTPSVAYATVYPLSMFMRVIIAQLILMILL